MKTNNNLSGGFEIITLGLPDFDNLTKTEKRLLLLPLVDTIRDFYRNPENQKRFEKWKSENEITPE